MCKYARAESVTRILYSPTRKSFNKRRVLSAEATDWTILKSSPARGVLLLIFSHQKMFRAESVPRES